MLPKSSRLPIVEAARVRRFGRRFGTSQFQVTFLEDSQHAQIRWLIQIPKRIVPLSTDRNRLKRTLSEAIIQMQPTIKSNGSIILQLRQGIAQPTTMYMKNVLQDLLKKELQ